MKATLACHAPENNCCQAAVLKTNIDRGGNGFRTTTLFLEITCYRSTA